MRRQVYVNFHVPRSDGSRVRRLVQQIGCAEWWEEPHNDKALPHLAHRFDGDDPRLAALLDMLRRESIDWLQIVSAAYSEQELRSAPLLRLLVRRDVLEGGGCEHGTVFDLSTGCPACGTGAVQTSALMVTVGDARDSPPVAEARNGIVVVNHRVAVALRAAQASGIELRQTRIASTGEMASLWQIIPQYTMPKMSPTTQGIVWGTHMPVRDRLCTCNVCCRESHYDSGKEPSQIVYDPRDVSVDELPDIVETWECFGQSWPARSPSMGQWGIPAHGLLLVKPHVRDVFRRLRVRAADFQPVQISDPTP